MTRVGTLSGFQVRLLNHYHRASEIANLARLRTATGKRINSPSDDPAGFQQLVRRRVELSSANQAIKNAERVESLAKTAETGLGDLATHLETIRTKALEAAGGGLSQSELEANQASVDDAIRAIDLIAGSTSFSGARLLDGSLARTSGTVTGLNSSQFANVSVRANTADASQNVDVNVQSVADVAVLNHQGFGGFVTQDGNFTLTGTQGSRTYDVRRNDRLSTVESAINKETHLTGVTATVKGDELVLESTTTGSNAHVAVVVNSGSFNVAGGIDGSAFGTDLTAEVNGEFVTADGNTLNYSSKGLELDITLNDPRSTGPLDRFSITPGQDNKLDFNLGANANESISLSLNGVSSWDLGGSLGKLAELKTGGGKSLLDGKADDAIQIVDDAVDLVTAEQAKVGSFLSTGVGSIINRLNSQTENLTEYIGILEDADVAAESAIMVQQDILATNALDALIQSTSNFFPVQDIFQLINDSQS